MAFSFYKYQGTGNDFIIMDNRTNNIQLSKLQVKNYAIVILVLAQMV